ncbi:MAG: tetratricopeptide repeat protein, partial [Bauldia sp.]|nr:tetratricopeptide repeat protein [Bauldia sp.]
HPEALSPGAALDRGWCLMDLDRPVEAAAVFEVALRSTAAATRRDAAYGAALAYLRAGLTDRAAVAITQAEQSESRVREVQAAILAQRATSAYADGRYREAILALDERARIVRGEQNDLMMIRGYSHLELGQLLAARAIFEAVAATGHPDAIQALANVENLSTISMEPAR